jgi:hypothetical protein
VAEVVRTHRPRVLLARSLGSVVAYEALRGDPGLRVEPFVTLGSPLAMHAVVFERLRPELTRRLRGVSGQCCKRISSRTAPWWRSAQLRYVHRMTVR